VNDDCHASSITCFRPFEQRTRAECVLFDCWSRIRAPCRLSKYENTHEQGSGSSLHRVDSVEAVIRIFRVHGVDSNESRCLNPNEAASLRAIEEKGPQAQGEQG